MSGTMGMSFIYFSDIVWNAGTICEKGDQLDPRRPYYQKNNTSSFVFSRGEKHLNYRF